MCQPNKNKNNNLNMCVFSVTCPKPLLVATASFLELDVIRC